MHLFQFSGFFPLICPPFLKFNYGSNWQNKAVFRFFSVYNRRFYRRLPYHGRHNSQYSVLKGRKDWIGKVNGDKITYNDYTRKYEEDIKNMEDQMRGQPMSDDQRNSIRTQTWNSLVNDMIFHNILISWE